MRSFRVTWARAAAMALLLPAVAAAEGGSRIVLVADSRRFSGWEAWWANVYNDSLLVFAILTIVAIPVLGLIMAVVTDFLMKRVGINLKSRVLSEH